MVASEVRIDGVSSAGHLECGCATATLLPCEQGSGSIEQVSRQTMDWVRMGRLVVTVHTAAVPDDKEWVDYLTQADAYLPLSEQRILVVSAGGGPNGPQRKGMTDTLGGAKVPVAILTSSMMMRGAGIAVSWFNPSLKVFGPDGLDIALNYLELTPWERTESIRVLKELQAQLGVGVVGSPRALPYPTRQAR